MKRVIKYYNKFSHDKADFSTSSTEREILPILVENDADGKTLRAIAKKLGLKVKPSTRVIKPENKRYGAIKITHALPLNEQVTKAYFGKTETYQVYLGLVDLESYKFEGPLELRESVNQPIDYDTAIEIVNHNAYGISDYGEHIDGQDIIVKSGWEFYHIIPLLGYSLESFLEVLEAEDYGFEDDTDRCSECGVLNSRDNGYTYNFRYIESVGNLGLHCGCFADFAKSPEAIEHYTNNARECIELEIAESLEELGKLEHIGRYFGGVTGGRPGYWKGEVCPIKNPDEVLKEELEKNPDAKIVFSHDESGQFQTYFSAWKVKE